MFEDFDVIVAAGGDGTINEVVNGLAAYKDDPAAPGPRLGIIPLGTANVLAIEIGLEPKNIEQIARTIAAAIVTSLSGGHIDPLAAAAGVSAGWGLIHASDATPPK